MLLKELWPDDDNKKVVGKPDAMYVSMTERYEVRHFIEQFLTNAGKSHTVANRQAVLDAVNSYKGRAPVLRSALTTHVQAAVKWPATPKP